MNDHHRMPVIRPSGGRDDGCGGIPRRMGSMWELCAGSVRFAIELLGVAPSRGEGISISFGDVVLYLPPRHLSSFDLPRRTGNGKYDARVGWRWRRGMSPPTTTRAHDDPPCRHPPHRTTTTTAECSIIRLRDYPRLLTCAS